jgi:hypothetical protein
MSRVGVLLAALLGFALRLHALADVPLRWDEGWSIALATLPLGEVFRLTALDVHHPLYYVSLAPWVSAGGAAEFWLRALSAFAGTLAVPLAAVAAAAWWRPAGVASRRAGLFAAALVAIAPAFLYYAGVARMYAITAPLLLLAVWGLARFSDSGRRPDAVAGVLGAAAALYAFYYTGFALAGLFAAALVARPRTWRRTMAVAAAAGLLYLPWMAYAAPLMLGRVSERTGASGFAVPTLFRLADDGLLAALFLQELRGPAVAVTLIVFAAGVAAARPRLLPLLGVVVLPVVGTLFGAALGAQAHMFAARYAIVATPFIALGLGWAVAGLWDRAPVLGGAGLLALALAAAPTITGYVYARSAEVSGDYDPAAVQRELADHTNEDDIVAFNILSLAGAYERHRAPGDPDWTYGQVWDPVREPPDVAIERVRLDARSHPRLWLVLYKGTASPGSAALKEWADQALYPTEGWWTEDTLFQGYVNAVPDRGVSPKAEFSGGAQLIHADYSSTAEPGGGVAVKLIWKADRTPDSDARVYVHAYGPTGDLVAQHDSFPAFDTRPPTTWLPGEEVYDRHGLSLPQGASGPLTIVVGLYDPDTGQRWTLPDGSDGVRLGQVEID